MFWSRGGGGGSEYRFWALGCGSSQEYRSRQLSEARTGVQPRTDSVPLPSGGSPHSLLKASLRRTTSFLARDRGRPNGAQVRFPELWILVAAFPWPFSQEAQTTRVGTGSLSAPGFSEVGLGCCSRTSGSTSPSLEAQGQGRASPSASWSTKECRLSLSRAHLFPAPGRQGRQRLVPGSAMPGNMRAAAVNLRVLSTLGT